MSSFPHALNSFIIPSSMFNLFVKSEKLLQMYNRDELLCSQIVFLCKFWHKFHFKNGSFYPHVQKSSWIQSSILNLFRKSGKLIEIDRRRKLLFSKTAQNWPKTLVCQPNVITCVLFGTSFHFSWTLAICLIEWRMILQHWGIMQVSQVEFMSKSTSNHGLAA